MGSLIALLVDLTQTMLNKRLADCEELRAQVMEVTDMPVTSLLFIFLGQNTETSPCALSVSFS